MKKFLWRIRYAVNAVYLVHCSPALAWDMAVNSEDYFLDGYSSGEALLEELTYWGD